MQQLSQRSARVAAHAVVHDDAVDLSSSRDVDEAQLDEARRSRTRDDDLIELAIEPHLRPTRRIVGATKQICGRRAGQQLVDERARLRLHRRICGEGALEGIAHTIPTVAHDDDGDPWRNGERKRDPNWSEHGARLSDVSGRQYRSSFE